MPTRLLACGDLHLRQTSPKLRLDNFLATQECKLRFIIQTAEERKCQYIVFPGDVFHRHDAPHGLVEWAIRVFKEFTGQFLFVYGQHDLRYHTSDKLNTPLGVLVSALEDQATVLSSEAVQLDMYHSFYGCSWGEPLPEVEFRDNAVVVLHRPVTIEKLPWEHKDLITVKELMKQCKAKVFICGDNHTRFTASGKNSLGANFQLVLNMGSVMRTTIAQLEHSPAVAIVTLDGGKTTYEIEPIMVRKVFDAEQITIEKAAEDRRNERLEKLIKSLGKTFNANLSFLDNLRMAAQDADEKTAAMLTEIISV